MSIQTRVERFREEYGSVWTTPHPRDTLTFLFTEVAEIADWVLREMPMPTDVVHGYLRMDDEIPIIDLEIGDAAIMLATLASQLGINLDVAVSMSLAKIKRKIIHSWKYVPESEHESSLTVAPSVMAAVAEIKKYVYDPTADQVRQTMRLMELEGEEHDDTGV